MNAEKQDRVPSICPHTGQCGGCSLSGITYEEQLLYKQKKIQKLLSAFGTVETILPAPQPMFYRNKVVRSFAATTKPHGSMLCGIYAAQTRRVVPITHCLLEDTGAQAILASVRDIAGKQHIPAFDVQTGRGVLRHAMVRAGQTSGEYLLILITGSQLFPGRSNFIDALRRAHPEIRTIVQNINPSHTGMVLGDPQQTRIPDRILFGSGTIQDTLCGLTFRISAHSFYQVNAPATELLYRTAVEMADLRKGMHIFDSYCGIGTIGMTAASMTNGIRVTGVELNAAAVKDAIANVKRNHMQNIRIFYGDAGEFLTEHPLSPDVVFLDPPRSGSDETFLSALCRARPPQVIYISCGPDSLARDLQFLTKTYHVDKIQPVDLFPWTDHVETICSLSKKI